MTNNNENNFLVSSLLTLDFFGTKIFKIITNLFCRGVQRTQQGVPLPRRRKSCRSSPPPPRPWTLRAPWYRRTKWNRPFSSFWGRTETSKPPKVNENKIKDNSGIFLVMFLFSWPSCQQFMKQKNLITKTSKEYL